MRPLLSLLCFAAAPLAAQSFDPEARLRELGITLPAPDKPVANYVKAVGMYALPFNIPVEIEVIVEVEPS